MFEEAIGHLVEREADILQADFLAGDVEGEALELAVHRAQHARQHGAVADPGIEEADGRRGRLERLDLLGGAFGDDPLFGAGVHEHQIFLTIVVEAEIRFGGGVRHARRIACDPGQFLRLSSGHGRHASHPIPCLSALYHRMRRRCWQPVSIGRPGG
jgi:hypothetical protein